MAPSHRFPAFPTDTDDKWEGLSALCFKGGRPLRCPTSQKKKKKKYLL